MAYFSVLDSCPFGQIRRHQDQGNLNRMTQDGEFGAFDISRRS